MSTPAKDLYFTELKEWSGRKLKLLTDYLEPATKIMSSIGDSQRSTKVYYIDGFAGAGIYDDGGKGSPVRAAELAMRYRDEGKSYTLKCINVEERKNNFANLKDSTRHFGNLVLNFSGTFASNVDPILREIGDVPAVCFLDPFGIEGLEWDALVKVIYRSGPTDFWIRFPADYVLRLDGFYQSGAPEAASKRDIITRTYGINDIHQIHTQLSGDTPEIRRQQAIGLYLARLRSSLRTAKGEGYTAFYQLKTLDEEDKYYLVFATSNKKGIVLASNIVYGIEQTYQKDLQEYKTNNTLQTSMIGMFGLDPTADEIFANKVAELKEEVWAKYRGKRQVVRRDIHAYLVTESHWFGKMKAPHMTQVFSQLANPGDGRIAVEEGTAGNEDAVFTFRS